MNKIKVWLVSIFLLGFGLCAQAATESAASLLQSKLQSMVSLQGDFTQALYNAKNELLGDKNQGNFLLQRPGRFYWKTEIPFEQLLVSDQKTIWLYEPDLEQVTVRPFTDDLQQTPALLLSNDVSEIEENFTITHTKTSAQDLFTLKPKSDEQLFTSLLLQFNGASLAVLTVNDSLDQRTVFTLTNTKINLPLDESKFSFSIPEGVDVLID